MFCKTKKFCFLETGGLAFVDLAVQNIANFFKFFVVDFVFCHNYHGHSDLVAMVGGLQIVEGIGNQAHAAVELDAVFGHLVVGFFHFEHDLLFLLREEVEEDDFAEALVAQFLGDGEVLDVDKLVEGPVGEDSDGVVAIVGLVGGDHEMK